MKKFKKVYELTNIPESFGGTVNRNLIYQGLLNLIVRGEIDKFDSSYFASYIARTGSFEYFVRSNGRSSLTIFRTAPSPR